MTALYVWQKLWVPGHIPGVFPLSGVPSNCQGSHPKDVKGLRAFSSALTKAGMIGNAGELAQGAALHQGISGVGVECCQLLRGDHLAMYLIAPLQE